MVMHSPCRRADDATDGEIPHDPHPQRKRVTARIRDAGENAAAKHDDQNGNRIVWESPRLLQRESRHKAEDEHKRVARQSKQFSAECGDDRENLIYQVNRHRWPFAAKGVFPNQSWQTKTPP